MNIAQLQALFLKPIPRQTSVLALILRLSLDRIRVSTDVWRNQSVGGPHEYPSNADPVRSTPA